MEDILYKKKFSRCLWKHLCPIREYIMVWCSTREVCKYISKNAVNLELIRGAMDCWRDEKKARAGMESLAFASIFTHSCIYELAFRGKEKS